MAINRYSIPFFSVHITKDFHAGAHFQQFYPYLSHIVFPNALFFVDFVLYELILFGNRGHLFARIFISQGFYFYIEIILLIQYWQIKCNWHLECVRALYTRSKATINFLPHYRVFRKYCIFLKNCQNSAIPPSALGCYCWLYRK